MSRRDSGIGRNCQSARDARYNLKIDPRLGAGLDFLTAPAKNKRVAALKPNYHLVHGGFLDQERIDPVLRHRMPTGEFANGNHFGIRFS